MATQKDEWLHREMGDKVERWVAKYRCGWLSRDGWFSREMGESLERKVAKYRDGWLSTETGGSEEG